MLPGCDRHTEPVGWWPEAWGVICCPVAEFLTAEGSAVTAVMQPAPMEAPALCDVAAADDDEGAEFARSVGCVAVHITAGHTVRS